MIIEAIATTTKKRAIIGVIALLVASAILLALGIEPIPFLLGVLFGGLILVMVVRRTRSKTQRSEAAGAESTKAF